MFLTDVAGWLRDPADPASAGSVERVPTRPRRRPGGGGMRPKLSACLEAIHAG